MSWNMGSLRVAAPGESKGPQTNKMSIHFHKIVSRSLDSLEIPGVYIYMILYVCVNFIEFLHNTYLIFDDTGTTHQRWLITSLPVVVGYVFIFQPPPQPPPAPHRSSFSAATAKCVASLGTWMSWGMLTWEPLMGAVMRWRCNCWHRLLTMMDVWSLNDLMLLDEHFFFDNVCTYASLTSCLPWQVISVRENLMRQQVQW